MSDTRQDREVLGEALVTEERGTPVVQRRPVWIAVAREARGTSTHLGDPYVRRLSRDVECLRAACVRAGPLRRWWLRRRLRVLMGEKARLEQTWRRGGAPAPPAAAAHAGGRLSAPTTRASSASQLRPGPGF
jgi:hypothetical protein